MKTLRFYQKILVVALLTLFGGQGYAQTCTTIAGGSNFDGVPSAEEYRDFNSTAQIGLSGNRLTTPLDMIKETTVVGSDAFYVVVDNPTLVDEEFLDVDDPMLVIAGADRGDELFSFDVSGLKPGSNFTVTIEGYLLNSSTTYACDGVNSSGNDPSLQILLDPQSNYGNNAGWATHTKDQSIKSGLGGNKFTVTITGKLPATQTGFSYVIKTQNWNTCMAVGFSKIEVVGCIDPKVVGPNEVCAGGESATLSAATNYQGAVSYQWYKDGVLIPGATDKIYRHSSNVSGIATTTYHYTMTIGASSVVDSEKFIIKDILCCTDDLGNPTSRKLIWQEDYGTFTSANSYWIWDYSDIANPKKVQKTAANDYRRESTASIPSYTIPNAKYVPTGDVPEQGAQSGYAIIANIAQGVNGLNWAAKAGDGTQYAGANYFKDHTERDPVDKANPNAGYGACLMINCSGNAPEKLYDHKIEGLCEKKLTIKCFINNFSDGSTPIMVQIRITNLDESTIYATSPVITRYADGRSGAEWTEVSVDAELPSGESSVRFQVLSTQSGATGGNDLLLDDIRVYTCSAPSVDLYFDLNTYVTSTMSCEGDDVALYADETPMLTNYYGAALAYLFQYTTEDPASLTFDKKSWKNINAAPVAVSSQAHLESIFTDFKNTFVDPNGKKLYFRVVAGDKGKLTTSMADPNFYFNADDPCSDYAVSKPIEAEIDCKVCEKPDNVLITSAGGVLTGVGISRTVNLCEGESTTLSAAATHSGGYDDYTITWHKGGKNTPAVGTASTSGLTSSSLIIDYTDVTATGVTYYVKVADNFDLTAERCYGWDSILIKANPTPTATLTDTTICMGSLTAALMPVLSIAGHTVTWYTDLTGTTAGGAPTLPDLNSLTADKSYYYTVTDATTGCVSEVHEYKVTVNPEPAISDFSVAAICSGEEATLTPETSGNTIPSGTKYTWSSVTSGISGASSEVTGETTITSGNLVNTTDALVNAEFKVVPTSGAGCVGTEFTVTVPVNPEPKIADLTVDAICSEGTFNKTPDAALSGNIIPSGTTYSWSAPIVTGIIGTASGTGEASVSGSLTNTTNAPISVEYLVTPKSGDCEGTPFKVTVTVNPKPAISPISRSICSGGTFDATPANSTDGIVPAGTKYTWTEPVVADITGTASGTDAAAIAGTLQNTSAGGVITVTYTVTPTFGTCPGATFEVAVSVEKVARPAVNDVSYLLSEGESGSFANDLLAQSIKNDPSKPAAEAQAGNALIWYGEDKLPTAGNTIPTPPVPAVGTTEDTHHTYYVKQVNPDGCESDTISIHVIIYAAPSPTTSDVEYCKDEAASPLTAQARTVSASDNVSNYTLQWYETTDKNELPVATGDQGPTPSTTAIGRKTYYVSQKHNVTGAEGTRVPLNVTVYGVLPPTVDKTAFDICHNDPEITLTAGKNENVAAYNMYSGMEWYKTAVSGTPLSSDVLSIQTDVASVVDETKYLVRQYYTNANLTGKCYGDPVEITVTVNKLPELSGTFKLSYKMKDLKDNTAKNLMDQNQDRGGSAIIPDPTCANCELRWYDENMTPLTPLTTPPTPKYNSDWAEGVDQKVFYNVVQYNKDTGCESAPKEITVEINDSPKPEVVDLSYCANDPGAVPLTATVDNTGNESATFTLKWYDKDPENGGTLFSIPPTPNTSVAGKTSYFVTQYNEDTEVESNASELVVTVYAQPDLSIDALSAVCASTGGEINITDKWNVSNYASSELKPAEYYRDAAGAVLLPLAQAAKIPDIGVNTYYIHTALNTSNMTNFKGDESYCYTRKPVTVDIRELEIFTEPAGTCPDTEATLKVDLIKQSPNLGTLEYVWKGSNGETATTSVAEHKTQPLAGPAGKTYTFEVTVTDDVCTKNASIPVTIGDGPVETISGEKGTTVFDNSDNAIVTEVQRDLDGSYYTCGGEVKIVTKYISKDESGNEVNDFAWYLGSQKIGDGPDLTIPAAENVGTRTYALKYTNKCATSVDVTIRSMPLTVKQQNIPDMELCEDAEFKAVLEIEGEATRKVVWEKDGLPVLGETQSAYIIAKAKPEHTGIYSYVVTNRNCEVKGVIEGNKNTSGAGTTTTLNVSGTVNFILFEDSTAYICAGAEDGTVIELKGVVPATTELTWLDPDGTITQVSGDGLQITAIPPFIPANADDKHRSIYTYTVKGVNGYCSNTTTVDVYVDEPLTGMLDATPTICEGKTATIDAGDYNATSYVWTASVESEETLLQVARQTVTPDTTTTYYVHMERNSCQADGEITVEVTTNPVIIRIDSIDVRSRKIIPDYDFGTGEFIYSVDNRPFDSEDIKSELSFGSHKFYIRDERGCESSAFDYVVPVPVLFIPPVFTPNGDGTNDTWNVLNIEIFADAVISIYDRFGKLLTQYNGAEVGWDGKYLGKDMPATDYWYVIDVPEIDKQYVGHFTLLRK